MSYEVSKKGSVSKNDMSKPLLFNEETQRLVQQVEIQVEDFRNKVRDLESQSKIIGTDDDGSEFRFDLEEKMRKTNNVMKVVMETIHELERKRVDHGAKLKEEQLSAFKSAMQDQIGKFKIISQTIQNKQQSTLEFAKNTMKGKKVDDDEAYGNIQQLSSSQVDKQVLDYKCSSDRCRVRLAGEAEFYENVIKEREKNIHQISNIMHEINGLAKDLGEETKLQGEKLGRLDENVTKAHDNVVNANEELNQAEGHQKKGWKKLLIILIILIIVVGIILAVVLTRR